MSLRSLAIFDADLPVDGVWNDNEDEYIEDPGKAATVEIAQILRGLGCEVEEAELEPQHGWQFNFKSNGAKLWGQVTYIDEWYLHLACPSRLFGPAKDSWKALVELLPRLDTALRADPRISNLLWHDPMGGDKGSPRPGYA